MRTLSNFRHGWIALALLLPACSGDDRGSGDGTGGDGDGDGDGSGDGDGDGDGTGDGDGDGDGTGDGDGDGDGGPIKFDTLEQPDSNTSCECGNNSGYSYIWISNSSQSTVTKLNTATVVEEGRYWTRADHFGNPSRTSVTIDGKAVAVANREGGVTKVWAREEFCDADKNGQPGVQTSTGMNDILDWGEDDCVAWFTDFGVTKQRPVAWTAGVLDQVTCEYENQKLWTSECAGATINAHLLNADTGEVEASVNFPDYPCGTYGAYGGAVDSHGNFWVSSLTPPASLIGRVDIETMETSTITAPITGYGVTVDSHDRVWIAAWIGDQGASAARYDPETLEWAIANNEIASSMSGIQEDAEGRMWMNYWTHTAGGSMNGLTYIDNDTMQVGPPFDMTVNEVRGLSIDFDGYVWSTAMNSGEAFRFDPDTQDFVIYNQLQAPYTYSDMTGWGLQNTNCGPVG